MGEKTKVTITTPEGKTIIYINKKDYRTFKNLIAAYDSGK